MQNIHTTFLQKVATLYCTFWFEGEKVFVQSPLHSFPLPAPFVGLYLPLPWVLWSVFCIQPQGDLILSRKSVWLLSMTLLKFWASLQQPGSFWLYLSEVVQLEADFCHWPWSAASQAPLEEFLLRGMQKSDQIIIFDISAFCKTRQGFQLLC